MFFIFKGIKDKLEVPVGVVFGNTADKSKSALFRPLWGIVDAEKLRCNCLILSFRSQGKDKPEAPEKGHVGFLIAQCLGSKEPRKTSWKLLFLLGTIPRGHLVSLPLQVRAERLRQWQG